MIRLANSPRMDSDWLKARLDEIGKNQSDLARALGVDPAAVTRLFKGERQVQTHEIRTLATFLRMPLDQVAAHVGGEPASEPSENGAPVINVSVLATVITALEEWLGRQRLQLGAQDKAEAIALLYPLALDNPGSPFRITSPYENILRLVVHRRR